MYEYRQRQRMVLVLEFSLGKLAVRLISVSVITELLAGSGKTWVYQGSWDYSTQVGPSNAMLSRYRYRYRQDYSYSYRFI